MAGPSASVHAITPVEFERAVKGILDAAATGLVSYSSSHLEQIHGSDGDYIFDVTARFEALGVAFLVLVECKRYRRRVERQEVQVLRDKMASVGAQKGMLFATTGFQQGAVDYARVHGIALVRLEAAQPEFVTRGDASPEPQPSGLGCCGWWMGSDGPLLISADQPHHTRLALGLDEQGTSDPGESVQART